MEAGKSVGYRIVRCKELSFESKIVSNGKVPGNAVSYQFGCQMHPGPDNRLAFVLSVVTLIEGIQAFKLESETVFEISPFDTAISVDADGQLVDYVGIIPTLFGLSFSTMRGMVAIRTAGTVLENYPIPIIDAVSAVKNMMTKKG